MRYCLYKYDCALFFIDVVTASTCICKIWQRLHLTGVTMFEKAVVSYIAEYTEGSHHRSMAIDVRRFTFSPSCCLVSESSPTDSNPITPCMLNQSL
ncbi:hypothetical protein CDAR_251281 [Caerostris darwini]|uniref:Secreted protein n=1 Tax=Caerostris darwini TaxID=1538125 RepID=A0AAV4RA50_9ARAC|nr:hypothetical protein CDAR_251281 [Caerostris darwini]